MASEYSYTIVLEPDLEEGGFTVRVPMLPGCVTQGQTLEEAIAMARDAITLYVEDMIAAGEDVPVELERPLLMTIRVAPAA